MRIIKTAFAVLFFVLGCKQVQHGQIDYFDAIPQDLQEIIGPEAAKKYTVDLRQNPFYIQLNNRKRTVPTYILFLAQKQTKNPVMVLVSEGKVSYLDIRRFTGVTASLKFCKPVGHFPAGAALPPNTDGFCP